MKNRSVYGHRATFYAKRLCVWALLIAFASTSSANAETRECPAPKRLALFLGTTQAIDLQCRGKRFPVNPLIEDGARNYIKIILAVAEMYGGDVRSEFVEEYIFHALRTVDDCGFSYIQEKIVSAMLTKDGFDEAEIHSLLLDAYQNNGSVSCQFNQ